MSDDRARARSARRPCESIWPGSSPWALSLVPWIRWRAAGGGRAAGRGISRAFAFAHGGGPRARSRAREPRGGRARRRRRRKRPRRRPRSSSDRPFRRRPPPSRPSSSRRRRRRPLHHRNRRPPHRQSRRRRHHPRRRPPRRRPRAPSADHGGDNPTVLDKIGSFQDIEDLDLGDLLAVRSGEGGSRTADDEPGTVYVVTEEDIRRSGARGLHEVLETVPGLEVVTDNLGRGRVIVRGVPGALTSGGSENVLVLLNGLKLNENITGGAFAVNLDLPVDNIKRIEVVRGPGSALYGAGAFLGVINIVTEGVDTFRRDELTLGGGSFRTFLYNFRYGTTSTR